MASRKNKFQKSRKNKVVVNTNDNNVKLKETTNPWKPNRLRRPNETDEDDVDNIERLYGKVRSILNKLTPNNLEVLVEQFCSLEIDSREKLNSVIKLVFERAIEEPIFSETYAQFCTQIKVHKNFQNSDPGSEHVLIRKLIIQRCQDMFEIFVSEDNLKVSVLEDKINECKDLEKIKALEEEKRRIRIRSVGVMKFIGEIFKAGGLIEIMMFCINTLLSDPHEVKLECLCKLISTVGETIEAQHKQSLNEHFEKITKIATEKPGNISNRIRFMLMDLIDLRERNWAPRFVQDTPTTIDELELEFSKSLAVVRKSDKKKKVKMPDQKHEKFTSVVGIVTNNLEKGPLMMTLNGQNVNQSQNSRKCFKDIQKTLNKYGMADNMRFLMIDNVPKPPTVIELDSILTYYPSECPLKNQVRFDCKRVYRQLIKLMIGRKRDLKHIPSGSIIPTWPMVNIGDEVQTPLFAQIFLLALFESCSEVNENNVKVMEDTFAKMLGACQQAVNKDESSQNRCRDAVREHLFNDPKTTKDLFYRIYYELQEGASWDEVAKSLRDILQKLTISPSISVDL